MKNPNRYGTCYKLSGKRRNPYIARAYTGRGENGKPIYQTIGYFRTKTEGMKALAEFNVNPYDVEKSKYTLLDVYKLWKDEYLKYRPDSIAFKNYEKAFKHFKPLYDEEFNKLKVMHWQCLFDHLGEKYTLNYLRSDYVVLGMLYKFALKNDICTKDYSKFIRKTGKKKKEQEYFTQLEVAKIYKAVGKVENADAILTLCLTGLRPSELFNITKFNVDFENRIITGIGIKTDAGKSKRVPISKYLIPILKERYEKADTYLFAKKNNEKMNYQYFMDNVYRKAIEKIGVKYKSPKACRHFFATITNELNLNDKARIKIMGHSNVNMTNNVYTHTEDRFLKNEFEKIDNRFDSIF